MKTSLKIPNREPEVQTNGKKQGPLDPMRFIPFYVLIVVAAAGFVARLAYLQIALGDDYDAQARENRESRINIPTARGIITDRYGVQLARNVPSYNITITP